jgi:hypothetical protein
LAFERSARVCEGKNEPEQFYARRSFGLLPDV